MNIKYINENELLILIYDSKNKRFIDKTNDIISINVTNLNASVYYRNATHSYTYILNKNIIIYNKPTVVDINNHTIILNNKVDHDIYKIIKFDNKCYKIFKGYHSFLVHGVNIFTDRIIIEYIDLNIEKIDDDIVNYYKNLALHASNIDNEDLSVSKLLYNLYNKVASVNKDSALYCYTHDRLKVFPLDESRLIFPFRTNKSQMKAVINTFKNAISVISGPPGTGKTQVILNIISNALVNNYKIAVISNNNSAVKNVYDKLDEYELSFFLANLGNKDNVSQFFSQDNDINECIKNFSDIKSHNISFNFKLYEELFNLDNEIISTNNKLIELKKEYKNYKNSNQYVDFDIKFDNAFEYLQFKNYVLSIKKYNIFKKLKLKLKYKLSFKNLNLDELITYLDCKYYEVSIRALDERLSLLNKEKEDNLLNKKLDELYSSSMGNLKAYLYDKYISLSDNDFNKDNYLTKFFSFVNRYPVILSTTNSLLRNTSLDFMYDLVIVDEASQSDIMSSLLCMNVCKRIVIIGDNKQLSEIDNTSIYNASNLLAKIYNVPKCYQYNDNSILNSVLSLKSKVSNTLLEEHYRCDYKIINFCNKRFYENKLIICTKSNDNSLNLIHTAIGNHARKNPNGTGYYNDREAQEILNILKNEELRDIGIITPFRAQSIYVSNLIKNDYPNVEVDTIHKYQGRQKDVIILSTVVNDLSDASSFLSSFVTNNELLNVAISRAIKKLYVVVSDKVYRSSGNTISDLVSYIKFESDSINQGNVKSIFDSLYTTNYDAVMKSPLGKRVDSPAELLMMNLLRGILKDYPSYSFKMHVTLRNLVKDLTSLNNYELRYVLNPLTHVDFVIYDNLCYHPVLLIELDGVSYHDYNKVQHDHDEIKTRIITENKLNFLRIRTNEAHEKEKIINVLKNY